MRVTETKLKENACELQIKIYKTNGTDNPKTAHIHIKLFVCNLIGCKLS
jgi:hypothetical protein